VKLNRDTFWLNWDKNQETEFVQFEASTVERNVGSNKPGLKTLMIQLPADIENL
jgi:hypothetical protein